MAKNRVKLEEEAITIVEDLLADEKITAKEATILIRAICDKGNGAAPYLIPAAPAAPNMQPYVPSNVPGIDPPQPYPWKPNIIYARGTGNGFDGVTTTL